MDSTEEDGSADEAAMAAALGFSSFGAQPRPAKKRRVDQPGDDAFFVASNAAPPGTGANADPLPLHPTRGSEGRDTDPASQLSQPLAPPVQQQQQAQARPHKSSLPQGVASLPPRPPPALAGSGGPDGQAPGPDWSSRNFGGGGGGGEWRGAQGGGGWHASAGGRGGVGGGRGGAPRGGRSFAGGAHDLQDAWWTDYYDPSSNQNPWEWLEREKGLETDGEWLPRQARRGGTATGA